MTGVTWVDFIVDSFKSASKMDMLTLLALGGVVFLFWRFRMPAVKKILNSKVIQKEYEDHKANCMRIFEDMKDDRDKIATDISHIMSEMARSSDVIQLRKSIDILTDHMLKGKK